MNKSQIASPTSQFISSASTSQILQNSIVINATDPNHDWDNNEFVTGTGTLSDPYQLENLIIEIDGYENGIFISNSNKILLIKNCTILHKNEISSDKLMSSIGIYLQNCTNVQVTDCTVTQNSYGILLSNTTKILIEDSAFNNNEMIGIYSINSSQNHYRDNDIKQNNNTGFMLEFSNVNTISVNNISENYFYGIHLKNSNENIIRDCYIQDNGKRNVVTENSVGTHYSGNTRIEQWIDGFLVELGAVLFVTAYVIYKHLKEEKNIKKKKKLKKNIENES